MGVGGLCRSAGGLAGVCLLAALCLAGCAREKRPIGPQPPLTPPASADDPRAKTIESNAFLISEGGRLFRWHGCDRCHAPASPGPVDLGGGETVAMYRAISDGPPHAYAGKITVQQMWSLAAYIHSLPKTPPSKQRRGAADQTGEGQPGRWEGPTP